MALIKKYKWLLIVVGLILLLLIFFRQCSAKPVGHSNVYYVARNTNWYPLQLMGKDYDFLGFTDDLLHELGKELNLHFEIIDTGPDTMMEGLNSAVYDAAFTSMRPTANNQEQYLFSRPIFELGPVLVVRENSNIRSLAEMEGMTISVPYSAFNIYNAIASNLSPNLNYIIISYDSPNKALDSLVANTTDGVIMDVLPAYSFAEGFYRNKVKIVTLPLNNEGIRIITRHGPIYEKLIQQIDETLAKFEKNGTYDQFLKKWSLINPRKRYLESNKQE